MPYYQRLGDIPRKHHIWFHRNGSTPSYKNEGIAYEHVFTTQGFDEACSIMYHLRPPTRVRNVELIKHWEPKKVTESPLRHHHLKTAAPMRSSSFSKAAAWSRRFSENCLIARKITSSFPAASLTGLCRTKLK